MKELTQQLRTLLKVAEHQSFAAAARELDIASSTATRHVNQLERHLGEPLLVRTTRHVRLSPAGEHALVRFRAILAEVEHLTRDLDTLGERVAGPLRVSVPWRYSRLYLAPMVSEFMQLYPEVALEIISSDDMVDLVKNDFDVAIRIGHLDDSSLIARRITDQRFMLAAALLPRSQAPDQRAERSGSTSFTDVQLQRQQPLLAADAGRSITPHLGAIRRSADQ